MNATTTPISPDPFDHELLSRGVECGKIFKGTPLNIWCERNVCIGLTVGSTFMIGGIIAGTIGILIGNHIVTGISGAITVISGCVTLTKCAPKVKAMYKEVFTSDNEFTYTSQLLSPDHSHIIYKTYKGNWPSGYIPNPELTKQSVYGTV